MGTNLLQASHCGLFLVIMHQNGLKLTALFGAGQDTNLNVARIALILYISWPWLATVHRNPRKVLMIHMND